MLTSRPAQPQEIVLVHHAADRAEATWLIEVLERAGHGVVCTEPAGVVRLVAQRPPDPNRVILLLVTRRLQGDLHEHLPAIIAIGAAVLPLVLDDPQYFGWGRLDELLYLDLLGVQRDPAAVIVLHALERLRRGGAVKAVPEGDFVFISYAFDDDATATVVERHLTEDGYATFRATDFMFGADWVSMMDEAVRAAWLVVALISPAYLRSFWCYEEFIETAAERRMLVQIEHADKLDSVRDQWIPVRADLTGVDEPAFRDRLLALVRNERTLSARERSTRAAQERPPRRTTNIIDEYMSWVPWDDDLLAQMLHPQLRGNPHAAHRGSSLRVRRQAVRDFTTGRY